MFFNTFSYFAEHLPHGSAGADLVWLTTTAHERLGASQRQGGDPLPTGEDEDSGELPDNDPLG
jgi:hypothetical protein